MHEQEGVDQERRIRKDDAEHEGADLEAVYPGPFQGALAGVFGICLLVEYVVDAVDEKIERECEPQQNRQRSPREEVPSEPHPDRGRTYGVDPEHGPRDVKQTQDHSPKIYQRHPRKPYNIARVFTQLRRTTPRPLILACAISLVAAFFAVRYPNIKGTSVGSYLSTLLIALPSPIALLRYLGPRRATLSLLTLSIFGYAIEPIRVATGFPYGANYYSDALGPRLAGIVPDLLPLSYTPLVVGAVAAAWGTRLRLLHILYSTLLLVWMDAIIDPGAASLGFWVWPEGGAYYGVPLSNYAGWLLSGALATTLLLAAGQWSETPRPGLLDSAIIATSFWTGVAFISDMPAPAVLGALLLAYLLGRRSQLRASK